MNFNQGVDTFVERGGGGCYKPRLFYFLHSQSGNFLRMVRWRVRNGRNQLCRQRGNGRHFFHTTFLRVFPSTSFLGVLSPCVVPFSSNRVSNFVLHISLKGYLGGYLCLVRFIQLLKSNVFISLKVVSCNFSSLLQILPSGLSVYDRTSKPVSKKSI